MTLQIVDAKVGNRGRAFPASTIDLFEMIVDEVDQHDIAITARHLFYRLVGRGLTKDEKEYQRVLAALLRLRRSGDVEWSAITDGTRLKTRWVGYGNLTEAVDQWQLTYRRDVWRDAGVNCEVWSESRGLLATINEIAGEYGVATLGIGGFASASIGYETSIDVIAAAEAGRRFHIFHLGDYDPSGLKIGEAAESEIRWHLSRHYTYDATLHYSAAEYAGKLNAMFTYQRIALTADQVAEYDLPTAPPKLDKGGKIKGGHAKEWTTTTELDALDPAVLQDLVRDAIESVLPTEAWERAKTAEAAERESLQLFVEGWKASQE